MKKKIKIVCGKKTKTVFLDESKTPRVLTIFKLGSERRGWIPNVKHFDDFAKKLQDVKDGKTDTIVFHFGVTVEQIRLS